MELTSKNIEEYIRRFMEGETTNAEEKAIYRFFRTEEVPEHLQDYAPMFAWYEEGIPEENLPETVEEKTEPVRKHLLWNRFLPAVWNVGIAAMLVIGIGLGILSYFGEDTEEWSCYEGSYVEVNGKRITDVEEIMPCILETMAEADRIERQIEERLEAIRNSEKAVMEKEMMLANY